MRFITEFELAEGNINNKHLSIEARKDSEMKMGFEMGNTFGWEISPNGLRHKIAIEAFPMDKWAKFRAILVDELWSTRPNHGNIINALKELESFSKPSRDAKQSSIL